MRHFCCSNFESYIYMSFEVFQQFFPPYEMCREQVKVCITLDTVVRRFNEGDVYKRQHTHYSNFLYQCTE